MWYFRIQILLLTGLSWIRGEWKLQNDSCWRRSLCYETFCFYFMDKSSSLEWRYLTFGGKSSDWKTSAYLWPPPSFGLHIWKFWGTFYPFWHFGPYSMLRCILLSCFSLAGDQVPTKAALSLSLLNCRGERKYNEGLMGWGRDRERSLTNYHHGQNRVDLGKLV